MQVSADSQVPNITRSVLADENVVHWLRKFKDYKNATSKKRMSTYELGKLTTENMENFSEKK